MEDRTLAETFATAVRHHQTGRDGEAESLYRRILEEAPQHAGALHLLGVLMHQRGEHSEGIALISRAIDQCPDRASYHNNLGAALLALGHSEKAGAAFRRAVALKADYADAHSNLGMILRQAGDLIEARRALETALRFAPAHIDALHNLADLLHDLGEYESAILSYRRALAYAPDRANLWNNLGNALVALEQDDEAVEAYRRAVACDPQHLPAHINLGTALARLGRVVEAADRFVVVSRLEPDEPLWRLRGATLCPMVFPDTRAIDQYRAALESVLDGFNTGVPLNLDTLTTSGCHPPSFELAHHGREDRALKSKFAAVFHANFPSRPRHKSKGNHRIGFVVTPGREGGFLRSMAGIIDGLPSDQIRPVVFSPERGIESLRAAITNPVCDFVPLPNPFKAVVERVAAAHCDVLYHWQIGTDAVNYFLPFARLAPVQCTSWGTHGTSGVPSVDYYLSSTLLEPEDADAHYSETLVRLTTLPTYQRRPTRPDPPATRAEFGLPEDAHLYCCLQRVLKFHPEFDALLAGVLRRDPHGLVLIRDGRAAHAAALLRQRFFTSIPDVAERIRFLPGRDTRGYYRLLSLADVVLDTYPYGAGLTAYDIFGLDLPLVTLPGPYAVGRYA